MRPKRHHYLPQVYLKRFIPEGETVFWVYDKAGGPPRPQTPINTGVEGRLYTILDQDGVPDDALETSVLGPIDNSVEPILARWCESTAAIRFDERQIMAGFLAALHVRVPCLISFNQEFLQKWLMAQAKRLAERPDEVREFFDNYVAENLDEDLDFDTCMDLLRSADTNFEFTVDRKFAMVTNFTVATAIFQELMNMQWRVILAPEDAVVATSDAPVVTFSLDPDGMALFGGGFGLPHVQVTVPLSLDRYLFLDRGVSKYLPDFGEIERRLVYQVDHFVISPRKSDRVQELVREFAYTLEQPKVDADDVAELERKLGENESS